MGLSQRENEATERSGRPEAEPESGTSGRADGGETEGERPEPSRKARQRPGAGGRSPRKLTEPRPRRGKVASSSEKEARTRQAGAERGGSSRVRGTKPKEMDFHRSPEDCETQGTPAIGSPVDEVSRSRAEVPRKPGTKAASHDGCRWRFRKLFGANGAESDNRNGEAPETHRDRQTTADVGR